MGNDAWAVEECERVVSGGPILGGPTISRRFSGKKQAPHHSGKHVMDPMLFSVAVLLAVSGAVKARASVRLGLGTPVLSLVELLCAVAVAGVSVRGVAGPVVGPGLATAGVLLLVVSSVRHARAVRGRRQRREASEARRLQAFLQMAGHGEGPSD